MLTETSTIFVQLGYDVSTLVILNIIIVVLLAIDFIRRIFSFGSHR